MCAPLCQLCTIKDSVITAYQLLMTLDLMTLQIAKVKSANVTQVTVQQLPTPLTFILESLP